MAAFMGTKHEEKQQCKCPWQSDPFVDLQFGPDRLQSAGDAQVLPRYLLILLLPKREVQTESAR